MDLLNALTRDEMYDLMTAILRGEKGEAWIESFLTTLAARGETVDEITGAVAALRDMAMPVSAPDNAVDCCGTGGDQKGTYNISTAVALVVAACGVPVAKHGNRAASSKSGAADVLEVMEVNLNAPKTLLESVLRDINFAFLMAPHHHGGMKHVTAVRKKIGQRTIFNLLGPLVNPAGTKRQLIGVFDRTWLEPLAQVLKNLGTEKAWLVSSSDGLDEISISGETYVCKLGVDGSITHETLTPDDFGLPEHPITDILGGSAADNAAALHALLQGQCGAYRDIVLANAAAVLVVADKVNGLKDGVSMATQTVDDGRALDLLERYIERVREQV